MKVQVLVNGVGWLDTQAPAPPKDAEGKSAEIIETTLNIFMRQLLPGELIRCNDGVGMTMVKAEAIQAVRTFR